MADARVRCINKVPHHLDAHYGITHLGGDGWKWSREQCIASILAGTNTFYTLVNGARAEVHVVDGPCGRYLRTHADGRWSDNLLALPECVG